MKLCIIKSKFMNEVFKMNKELREVINNAKESTLKHDGYGKQIY